MKATVHRIDEIAPRSSQPRFEIRSRTYKPGDTEVEIFQVPAPATPYIRSPLRVWRQSFLFVATIIFVGCRQVKRFIPSDNIEGGRSDIPIWPTRGWVFLS